MTSPKPTAEERLSGRAKAALACAVLFLVHVVGAVGFVLGRAPGTDAALTGFPLDDAWIHLVYGRSLIESGTLAYNATAEAGFTSPMWLTVVALGALAESFGPLGTVLTLKGGGTLLGWLTSVGVMAVTLRLGGGWLGGVVAGLMCALCPSLLFAQLSGMEVTMASAALTWALWFWLRRELTWAGVLLGVGVLTRPELGVVWLPFVALAALHGETLKERALSILKVAAPTGVGLGLWAIFCLSVSGHLLPNTFYAKFSASHIDGMWHIISGIVLAMPYNTLMGAVVLYLMGVVALALRPGERRYELWVCLALPWLFFLAISLTRMIPPEVGLFFYWQRYPLLLLPWLFIPVGVGAALLFGGARDGLPKDLTEVLDTRRRLWAALGALLLLVSVVDLPEQMVSRAKVFAWNCQNINEVQVAAGQWVNANVPEQAAVLVNDAGALKYFGNRHTVDLIGLNDREVLFTEGLKASLKTDPAAVQALMKKRGATHLIIFPGWFQVLTTHPDFEANFEPVARFHSEYYTLGNLIQDTKVAFVLK